MGSIGSPLLSTSESPARPSILFIDAYDSFSNNITSLLTTLLNVDVFVLPIDTPISKDDFRRELRRYAAVVCGPGPGSPENEADVGLMRWLWELEDDDLIPVLGVCLGFQSLVLACGGEVRRLRRALHGMVRTILHQGDGGDIFVDVASFKATLYHSLCADVGQDAVKDWEREKWVSPVTRPDLVPLAWVEEDRGDGQGTERILMAMKHRKKPFWGLQYHPESVCTEEEGNKVIRNWFYHALRWNYERGRTISSEFRDRYAKNATRTSLLQQFASSQPRPTQNSWGEVLTSLNSQTFQSHTMPFKDGIEVPDIADVLNAYGTDHIILDSANGSQPRPKTGVDVRGRFSVVAVEVDGCVRFEHHTGEDFITLANGFHGNDLQIPIQKEQTVWHRLAEFHESRRSNFGFNNQSLPDEEEVPFLGGFIGYITYEQGLRDIDIHLLSDRGHRRPDVCLAWVTKSIIIDHKKNMLHIQDLEGDLSWIKATVEKLQGSKVWRNGHYNDSDDAHCQPRPFVRKPDRAKYEAKVRMCQEYIAAGESYELCLTDQTHIITNLSQTPNASSTSNDVPSRLTADASWPLYRTLRRRNPAPFASYIRLGGATLVSSSPERFLQYNRAGRCSMKPMKGTVKKSTTPGPDCATTLAEAEAILHIPKEEAENLMIVDLVRHDLHGVCGAGRVSVPELLKVEEYQTVFTMITRVEGELPTSGERYSGLDVLAASLPPGSMTGAPKKRSCEILQQIEGGQERSLYSGVVGYMCVTGRGDWSVTIRSMFRWDDEYVDDDENGEVEEKKEVWHIGAGGAVTILSTPEGEREEMFVKLARPLSIFGEDA